MLDTPPPPIIFKGLCIRNMCLHTSTCFTYPLTKHQFVSFGSYRTLNKIIDERKLNAKQFAFTFPASVFQEQILFVDNSNFERKGLYLPLDSEVAFNALSLFVYQHF